MKVTNTLLHFVSIWLLSLFTANLNAQTIQVVTPQNAAASAEEIVTLFEPLINVTEGQIEAFYNYFLTGYTPYCVHPEASITDLDDLSASFDWDQVVGADSTVIGYMRLTTGQRNNTITNNEFVTVNIPNSLYLFVFQSKCGAGKSALDVIIIDKPMMMTSPKDCDCDRYEKIWTKKVKPTTDIVTYEWIPENEYELYHIDFYQEGVLNAYTTIELHFTEEGTTDELHFHPDCQLNMKIDFPGPAIFYIHAPGDETDLKGTLTFYLNGDFSFVPNGYGSGNVEMYRCMARAGGTERFKPDEVSLTSSVLFNPLHNPFTSTTQIQYSLPQKQKVSVYLIDAYGRMIKELKGGELADAGNHILEIDLQDYPSGIYTCILKTEGELLYLKLLKVN